jgi:hypothetical protein
MIVVNRDDKTTTVKLTQKELERLAMCVRRAHEDEVLSTLDYEWAVPFAHLGDLELA